MASTAIIIADAVVSALIAGPLPLPFTVERWYVPARRYQDLHNLGLVLSVVPMTIGGQILDRAGHYMEVYETAIGVQKLIGMGPMTNADIKDECDPLMDFVEQITEIFESEKLPDLPIAVCTNYRVDPSYSPQFIDERKIFISVVTLTHKIGI